MVLCDVEKLSHYLCAGLQLERCLILPHLLSPRPGGISPTLGETHVPSGSRRCHRSAGHAAGFRATSCS